MGAKPEQPTIDVRGLTVRYRRTTALNAVTWQVDRGPVGLVGPNGAGKSTLINCLVGLLKPSSGSVDIRGGARAAGYVPQRPNLPHYLRVSEAVEYCAWLRGCSNRDARNGAIDAIDQVGLTDIAQRRIGSLSGGQRQRVAIAAALAHRPTLLVLDEPTSGLDPAQRLSLRTAIANLDGLQSVVFATHLVEDIEHLCSTVAVLSQGKLRYDGPVSDLLKQADTSVSTSYGSAFENAYSSLVDGGE